ncbi:MAG TPA: hypothetical protein VGC96_05995 [Candidatus Elarobacter sp.]|jgi:hypothetical protein
MHLFLKVTGIVALALVALTLIGWILHLVILAAIIAAVVVGALAVVNLFRRRPRAVVRYEPPTYDARRYR